MIKTIHFLKESTIQFLKYAQMSSIKVRFNIFFVLALLFLAFLASCERREKKQPFPKNEYTNWMDTIKPPQANFHYANHNFILLHDSVICYFHLQNSTDWICISENQTPSVPEADSLHWFHKNALKSILRQSTIKHKSYSVITFDNELSKETGKIFTDFFNKYGIVKYNFRKGSDKEFAYFKIKYLDLGFNPH